MTIGSGAAATVGMTPAETVTARLLDPRGGCTECCRARIGWNGGLFSAIDNAPETEGGGLLAMPPLANAHDHVRGVRPTALGAYDLPLELWQLNMSGSPRIDPYLVNLAALGRSALGGTGSVMVHYTRPQDRTRVVAELESVARAANAIGIRVAIAVALRDCYPIGYAPEETLLALLDPEDRERVREKLAVTPDSPASQVAMVEDLAARLESPTVTVQYGPYGAEWCSDALLRAIAERSALTGRRVHMHLLESRLQREFLDARHPGGPVRYLDSIGMLSPRLSVAHAVWLRPEEMELLAARGVTVSINTSSNLTLRSGLAPVAQLHAAGVPLAMGMDGFSVDDDDDAYRELRLNYMLHRGVALDPGLPLGELLRFASYGGRRSISGCEEGPGMIAGQSADFSLLDYAGMARDLLTAGPGEASLLAARATAAMLKRMVIAGDDVVVEGRLARIDLDEVHRELDAQARHGVQDFLNWQKVAQRLREKLRGFYAAGLHACG